MLSMRIFLSCQTKSRHTTVRPRVIGRRLRTTRNPWSQLQPSRFPKIVIAVLETTDVDGRVQVVAMISAQLLSGATARVEMGLGFPYDAISKWIASRRLSSRVARGTYCNKVTSDSFRPG